MKNKKELKAASHQLKPVVIIGANGLTENIHNEIETTLIAHELIKIRINTKDQAARILMLEKILEKHNANLVNRIGSIAAIYRKNDEKEEKG
jgi:RNA-binding protein